MRPDPYKPPAWFGGSDLPQRRAGLLIAADVLLSSGFFCTAFAAALAQFVMVGLIGVGLLLVAFGLLVAVGLLFRADGQAPLWQQVASFVLYIIGVLSVTGIAVNATSLAFDHALDGTADPSGWQWRVLMLISVLAAAAIAIALLCRTEWSWSRCIAWGIAAFGVSPAAILLFWILKLTGLPLTA